MTAAVHAHRDAHPVRRFAGRPGVFVLNHGDWDRPLHVWRYRGAWRVVCWICITGIPSGDPLHDGGYATQSAAFDAAIDHCRDCPIGAKP